MLENTSGLDFEIDKLCMYFGCYGNKIRCYGCFFDQSMILYQLLLDTWGIYNANYHVTI